MKMKDLKKLAEKADEIEQESEKKEKKEEKRMRRLLKVAEAGLIKRPKCRWWQLNEYCPECGKKLIAERKEIGFMDVRYYYCQNKDYEYAEKIESSGDDGDVA